MEIIYKEKTLLKEHKERIKMQDKKQKNDDDNKELKEKMISRLINWKFGQAFSYMNVLEHQDSTKCLRVLKQLWGDTGWERGDTIFGDIISYLVELIRFKEGWTYKEFYNEEEEIDAI